MSEMSLYRVTLVRKTGKGQTALAIPHHNQAGACSRALQTISEQTDSTVFDWRVETVEVRG